MQALLDNNSTEQRKSLFDLSKIHTLAKILISFIASTTTVIFNSPQGLLSLFIFSLCYVLLIPRLKFVFYAYAFAFMLFCIACTFSFLISLISPIPFTLPALIIPFLRIVIMLNVILPLALTTSVQNLLASLKPLKLPFFIYLPAAVMIRFIPTFLDDIKQVSETLKIRGYNMSIFEMVKEPFISTRLLFTPLIFRSLRASEDLGIAGELKGMKPNSKVTLYKKEEWTKKDTFFLLVVFILFIIAIYIEIFLGVDVVGGHQ